MIVEHSAASADQVQTVDLVLVDDDELTLEIVAWILRDTDFSHKLFADHLMAASYLAEVTPRVLIVDYFMPRINGIEFLLELKESPNLLQSKLFLCSAIAPRSREEEMIKTMGVEVLEKQTICNKVSLLNILDLHFLNYGSPESTDHKTSL